jgi:hypothetical protein
MHQQFNLPTYAERGVLKPTQSDFEQKQANLLKTAKDLRIKEVFDVTDSETALRKGQRFNRTAVNSALYSISTSDYLVGVTSLAVAPSIGLPLPSLVGTGKTFIVKDEVGGALTTNITIRSEGEKNIDGASSTTLNTNYASKTFYSDGANWFII